MPSSAERFAKAGRHRSTRERGRRARGARRGEAKRRRAQRGRARLLKYWLADDAEEVRLMQLGMVGLGRMGANLVRRLMRDGHECVAFDVNESAVEQLESEGATGARSAEEFISKLSKPRVVWVMVPAAITGRTVSQLAALMDAGDVVIDGGNTYYRDDIDRAEELSKTGIHYVDVGTSGGVFGLERGFCLMIGGEPETVALLDPIFKTIAPGVEGAPRTEGAEGEPLHGRARLSPLRPGRRGPLREDGPQRHRVWADGGLRGGAQHSPPGEHRNEERPDDAETTPLARPRVLPIRHRHGGGRRSLAAWKRGRVVAARPDASALRKSPGLDNFRGRVSDSGEGRWTVLAAVEEGVPAHVITASLFDRFSSREEDEFANRLLSAMRSEFGGHAER
jgi:6-phosphogluconate dehydrogenase